MTNREHIKNEIDSLPDSVIDKIQEFITFQKFSLALFEHDKTLAHDMETAAASSTGFWDNADDEVWDHEGGLPFEIKQPRFNAKTELAIQEARAIASDKMPAKGYASANELFTELDAEY